MYAMQLASALVLPMVLKMAIEFDLLEIIAKAGPGAHISTLWDCFSPPHTASHLLHISGLRSWFLWSDEAGRQKDDGEYFSYLPLDYLKPLMGITNEIIFMNILFLNIHRLYERRKTNRLMDFWEMA